MNLYERIVYRSLASRANGTMEAEPYSFLIFYAAIEGRISSSAATRYRATQDLMISQITELQYNDASTVSHLSEIHRLYLRLLFPPMLSNEKSLSAGSLCLRVT